MELIYSGSGSSCRNLELRMLVILVSESTIYLPQGVRGVPRLAIASICISQISDTYLPTYATYDDSRRI